MSRYGPKDHSIAQLNKAQQRQTRRTQQATYGASYFQESVDGLNLPDQSKGRVGFKPIKLTAAQQRALDYAQRAKANEELRGLSATAQNRLAEYGVRGNQPVVPEDFMVSVPFHEMADYVEEPEYQDPNPNNAGDKITYENIRDSCHGPKMARSFYARRSRRDRLRKRHAAFQLQMEDLADAFLDWKYRQHKEHTSDHPTDIDMPPKPPDKGDEAGSFVVSEVCGLTWIRHSCLIKPAANTKWVGESMIAQGLISNSPEIPDWAISIHTLEHYRSLRLVRPNYSAQAFMKALSSAHGRTPSNSLTDKFIDALDVYLGILRVVDDRVALALGRNGPGWRIQNCCPACLHKAANEAPCKYRYLYSMDGGSANKRFAEAGTASENLQHHPNRYIIPASEVDEWKHVVKRAVRKKKPKGKTKRKATAVEESDESDANDNDIDVAIELGEEVVTTNEGEGEGEGEYMVKMVQGDPADSSNVLSDCVERWKANADDVKKGMFSCYDESGLFVAVCRHGILLTACDMIKSGELAKYPLSLVAKLESETPGPKCRGYDIWCAFCRTLEKAGIKIEGDGTTLAMHGWCHNRLCQCGFHPLYLEGVGLTDFEQCERWFSSSNNVAALTRHSTRFHRHQWLEMHCKQSDSEKYENLGKYIFYNYEQALDIIHTNVPLLKTFKETQNYGATDFEAWHEEEKAYLAQLKKEPPEDNLRCLYIEALQALEKAQDNERATLAKRDTQTHQRTNGKRATVQSERAIYSKTEVFQERVEELESRLGLRERWTAIHPDYIEAKKYLAERKYHLALDRLESLVVQRLMELQKCHIRGTNYKLRTQIAKHLQSRSATIRTALKAYNTAAKALGRPTLDFQKVIQHSFLSDFDLLRDARRDIRNEPWAIASNRVARDLHFKVRRAQEEFERLHIEMGRIFSWFKEEKVAYERAINELSMKPGLRHAVYKAYGEALRQQQVIRYWLTKTQNINGYMGTYYADIETTLLPLPTDDGDEDELPGDEEVNGAVDDTETVLTSMEALG